ncbi:hypothetical protein EYR36_000343 [Pleurotus pulmonarius]|nr:hypothetical protein EYR36_000343 [Pleurotus pulmonarius]
MHSSGSFQTAKTAHPLPQTTSTASPQRGISMRPTPQIPLELVDQILGYFPPIVPYHQRPPFTHSKPTTYGLEDSSTNTGPSVDGYAECEEEQDAETHNPILQCSLVCRAWLPVCRAYIYRRVVLCCEGPEFSPDHWEIDRRGEERRDVGERGELFEQGDRDTEGSSQTPSSSSSHIHPGGRTQTRLKLTRFTRTLLFFTSSLHLIPFIRELVVRGDKRGVFVSNSLTAITDPDTLDCERDSSIHAFFTTIGSLGTLRSLEVERVDWVESENVWREVLSRCPERVSERGVGEGGNSEPHGSDPTRDEGSREGQDKEPDDNELSFLFELLVSGVKHCAEDEMENNRNNDDHLSHRRRIIRRRRTQSKFNLEGQSNQPASMLSSLCLRYCRFGTYSDMLSLFVKTQNTNSGKILTSTPTSPNLRKLEFVSCDLEDRDSVSVLDEMEDPPDAGYGAYDYGYGQWDAMSSSQTQTPSQPPIPLHTLHISGSEQSFITSFLLHPSSPISLSSLPILKVSTPIDTNFAVTSEVLSHVGKGLEHFWFEFSGALLRSICGFRLMVMMAIIGSIARDFGALQLVHNPNLKTIHLKGGSGRSAMFAGNTAVWSQALLTTIPKVDSAMPSSLSSDFLSTHVPCSCLHTISISMRMDFIPLRGTHTNRWVEIQNLLLDPLRFPALNFLHIRVNTRLNMTTDGGPLGGGNKMICFVKQEMEEMMGAMWERGMVEVEMREDGGVEEDPSDILVMDQEEGGEGEEEKQVEVKEETCWYMRGWRGGWRGV